MKKLLITGCDGFVGKSLIDFYANKFHIIKQNRKIKLENALEQKPDFIINCAADIYDETLMFKSNVEMVFALIQYVKETKTRMIQIGSSSEYGRKKSASKESDFLDPTTPYEATKSAATMLCKGYAIAHDLSIVIARPYSVYGKYEKEYRLFPRLYESFINNKQMTLFNGYHDFIYINDFVNGLDILLNEDHNKIKGDIVNFGFGKQYSNFEIYELFKKITKKNGNVTIYNNMSKSFESDIWLCDTTHAKQKYNFRCEWSIEKGIDQFIKDKLCL